MLKCDFEITLRHGCSPVNLLHIFRTVLFRNTFGRVLLGNIHHVRELNHISPENLIKDSYLLKKQTDKISHIYIQSLT